MFNFHKKSDSRLQQDVMKEISWDPSISPKQITVTASGGIVTLRGSVPHYFEKMSVGDAAQRVGGVRGIADEITVDLLGSYERRDEDIAQVALTALDWNYQVPKGIKVFVDNAWITLKGEADYNFQRVAAERAVSQLMGVRGVTNEMTIKVRANRSGIKENIEDALKRLAESEARDILVDVSGSQVTLSGQVESMAEMDAATLAAWNAPGVTMVRNVLELSQ